MDIAVYSHYFTPEIGAPSARIYDMSQHWISSGDRVQVITCLPNHPTGKLYLAKITYTAGKSIF